MKTALKSRFLNSTYIQNNSNIKTPAEIGKVLTDSYLKLNRNLALKTKLPEEEKNKALFRVVILCSDILCCAKSDIIAYGNRDIETCTFSDILFAVKLPKAITLCVA